MMWPVGDFYDGNNTLSDDELHFAEIFEKKGRSDLAAIVRGGRRWQRYLFFLGGGIPSDKEEFEALFQGLRKSMLVEGEAEPSTYEEWKRKVLAEFAKENAQFKQLLDAERAKADNAATTTTN
jgi:hypothetical protein